MLSLHWLKGWLQTLEEAAAEDTNCVIYAIAKLMPKRAPGWLGTLEVTSADRGTANGWHQLLPTNDRNSWWERRATAGNCEWAWLGAGWKIILGARCKIMILLLFVLLSEAPFICTGGGWAPLLREILVTAAALALRDCRAISFFNKKKTPQKLQPLFVPLFITGEQRNNAPTVCEIRPFVNSEKALPPTPGGATSSWDSFFFFSWPLTNVWELQQSINKAAARYICWRRQLQ